MLAAGMIAATVAATACRSRRATRLDRRRRRGNRSAGELRPRLVVSPPIVDIGAIGFDEDARASITLRNDGPPRSRSASSSAAASARPDRCRLACLAGASTPLVVTCRADLEGALRERVVVRTNDPDAAAVPDRRAREGDPVARVRRRLHRHHDGLRRGARRRGAARRPTQHRRAPRGCRAPSRATSPSNSWTAPRARRKASVYAAARVPPARTSDTWYSPPRSMPPARSASRGPVA
jgi:hypothetical protein